MPVYDLTGQAAAEAVRGDLAVVMPLYNEAETICVVLDEWDRVFQVLKISPVFILIDDGSKDQTFEILKDLEKNRKDFVVVRKPNSGHGRSCRLGYDIAAAATVEWVLQIDSDGQCDPVYFREFWEQRNEVDCIFGQRVQRDDGQLRKWTSQCCRLGASILCGVDLKDPNVPYRLLRRNVLRDALSSIPSDFNIHNVALTYVLKKREILRWVYVPIIFRDRQGGSNSINVGRVMQWGVDMLFELARIKK